MAQIQEQIKEQNIPKQIEQPNCPVSLRDMDTPRKKYEEADRALKTDFWSVFWLVLPHTHAWASSPD